MRNHIIDPESSPSSSSDTFYLNQPTPGYDSDPCLLRFDGSDTSPIQTKQTKTNTNISNVNLFPNIPNNYSLNNQTSSYLSYDNDDYDNEPPLLEELGIRFDHILSKTLAVMLPTKQITEHILDDADLAGPLVFCLLLGSLLLLSGKIHFGYIYGFSMFGCLGMYSLLNLLHHEGIDVWRTCSVLGYCLLPVIYLATISIFISLRGLLGLSLSIIAISWSTYSSIRLFDAKLNLQITEQYWLVVYPIMLLYSCFVLITVF